MIIETERLILRPFTESDAADAFEYLHEPMVHCFACMKTETMDDARKAVLDRARDGEYYFAITLKENGKVIGEIDAMPEATAPDEKMPRGTPLAPVGCSIPHTMARDTPTRRLTPSSSTSSTRSAHVASTPIPRTTTWQVRSSAKSLVCAARGYLWSS